MIISHRHRFIFIKTEKTAGTSIEIALSKICGPEDIITPISPEDEMTRKSLGYRGAQNYNIPWSRYSKTDWLKLFYQRRRRCFQNHMGAGEIIKYLDREIWDSYFKFCFERNPWDKVISLYFWKHRKEPRPSISQFIESGRAADIKGFELYTIFSRLVVDQVFFYEQLGEAIKELGQRLNLPEPLSLPQAKSGFRKDQRGYREILSEQDGKKIAMIFAREIAFFNYKW